MGESVSHGFEDETPDAKALWFQSLPLEERMEMLQAECEEQARLVGMSAEDDGEWHPKGDY
jgi:hypothetical protein